MWDLILPFSCRQCNILVLKKPVSQLFSRSMEQLAVGFNANKPAHARQTRLSAALWTPSVDLLASLWASASFNRCKGCLSVYSASCQLTVNLLTGNDDYQSAFQTWLRQWSAPSCMLILWSVFDSVLFIDFLYMD